MNSSYSYRNLKAPSLGNDDYNEEYDYYAIDNCQGYEHGQTYSMESNFESQLDATGALLDYG